MTRRLCWLIETDGPFRTFYVHKSMGDGSLYWSSDDRTAERFTSADAATAFAHANLSEGVRVAEHRLEWM